MQLANTIGQGGFHLRGGAQGAQHYDRGDGLRGQLRRNVIVDRRQAQHLDMQPFSGRVQPLKIPARIPLQTEHQ